MSRNHGRAGTLDQERSPPPARLTFEPRCGHTVDRLPALAQVAEQQGKFLASVLNDEASQNKKHQATPAGRRDEEAHEAAGAPGAAPYTPPARVFKYHHLGSMASLTTGAAVIELGEAKQFTMTGLTSWLAWRSAYLTRLGTMKSKARVAVEWVTSYFSGRDISQQ